MSTKINLDKKYKISKELCEFMKINYGTEKSKLEVIKYLCDYVDNNNLFY